MMHKRLTCVLSFLVVVIFIFGSCMKEDYSNCGLYLKFKYTHHLGQTDKFMETVKVVDLFLFNSEGTFVRQFQHSSTQGDELHLQLEKGNYTFVAWGNLSEYFSYNTLQPGITTLDEAVLSLKRDAQNVVSMTPNPIYHAIVYDVTVKQIDFQYLDVDFYHHVNHVQVNVEGLPLKNPSALSGRTVAPAPGTRFIMSVTGSNGDTKFDNSRWEQSPTLTYVPEYQQIGPIFRADFTLMKLSEGDDTRLILQHVETDGTLRELYNESLSAVLLSSPEIDFGIDSEYQVNLKFDYTYTLIGITVNGWNVIENDDSQGGVIG